MRVTDKTEVQDCLDDPKAGWEVRAALDMGWLKLQACLEARPSKKPLLFCAPAGVSPALVLHLAPHVYTLKSSEAVFLCEDEGTGILLEHVMHGDQETSFPEIRVVIGTLETLAKTDADHYSGCVLLSYGSTAAGDAAPTLGHCVAKLCGWNSHVLLVQRLPARKSPLLGTEETNSSVLETCTPAERDRAMQRIISTALGRLEHEFAVARRRVTNGATVVAGFSKQAAVAVYMELTRGSTIRRPFRSVVGVPSAFMLTVAEAQACYRLLQKDRPEWSSGFMDRDMLKDWMSHT